MLSRRLVITVAATLMLLAGGCGKNPSAAPGRVMYLSAGDKIKTIDPAQAVDLLSQYVVASFYDTLLQYNYAARPYRLEPSMLAKMPEISPDLRSYRLTLRNDLYFVPDRCFGTADREQRRVTARDVAYSIMRIADSRRHSPVFWMFRDKIKGLDEFRRRTETVAADDTSVYDQPCEGLEIVDALTLILHLKAPAPRLSYALALPTAGIVSRRAVEYYGEDFAEHPVGSGPFIMRDFIRDYRIILDRNPDYRFETYHLAQNPADRTRPLPLSDRIVCYLVKQPLASWLMFLQGELDLSALNKDNFDAVVGEDHQLVKALTSRGIHMVRIPEFEVRYIGFNFADPVLGGNHHLRRALSLAYDAGLREKYFNYQIDRAESIIPAGVAGHDPGYRNPWGRHDLALAREYLTRAGYPNGIDPGTGRPLELKFDLGGTGAAHRQLAELMVEDMKKIGIVIKPMLNNRPAFFEKLRKGQCQLFRVSWVGDYPDAENFLQLFYGPNAGSCNRAFYRDAAFDRMYEQVRDMIDSPGRTEKYRRMAAYINDQNVWILEGYPIGFQLTHSWLQNYRAHNFPFNRWKYLTVDPAARRAARRAFRPLEMHELRR
ncbi:MAG: ABC transporter substrate-binding protein [Victivallales bacterium]|nr:ABC transporter substrate-binding protein [Victivallales bacterium]